ncbi:hypothetical protein QE408_000820 [Agrobacterium larrymoorei]|uniref:Uncharacterized protein n=1 Tax=Agrobacterium larrymoorei TaxID=160699 RepID=A0ABU0UFP3_9HYPH|nr:hypothetical protein [Agrobacterium larrymoorei]
MFCGDHGRNAHPAGKVADASSAHASERPCGPPEKQEDGCRSTQAALLAPSHARLSSLGHELNFPSGSGDTPANADSDQAQLSSPLQNDQRPRARRRWLITAEIPRCGISASSSVDQHNAIGELKTDDHHGSPGTTTLSFMTCRACQHALPAPTGYLNPGRERRTL